MLTVNWIIPFAKIRSRFKRYLDTSGMEGKHSKMSEKFELLIEWTKKKRIEPEIQSSEVGKVFALFALTDPFPFLALQKIDKFPKILISPK